MYIWNINALITALREDSFTEKQKKYYRSVFWIIIAISVLSFPTVFDFSTMNQIDIIDFICFVIINGIGLFVLFRIYKNGNKDEFFLPYISLAIPILLRFILLVIALNVIGYFLIYDLLPYQSLEETNLMDLTISIIAQVFYNLMYIHYFKKIYK
ncbi:hypothetical protein B857_00926 [Solibacillus isronensis B3W22]|uniref:Uncharacterized protein n=1 Tax=Solibacillus isronensis B3W22 TaxID=1224748 RepID=K1L1L6_9BACL|nr:hypothetical protein [Solibacillus isronensis]AMO84337.1 hypothetical protein SOLI23_01790 [Solibacillus silvestris]EKB46032.1 hypothetical protein B857_00926 [Solibacillus isronensis B3W22]